MTDYLIVGSGLAGIAFAETALRNKKSILVYDNSSHNSSKVAAGLYNPVILKRFSGIASAQEHLDLMNAFYERVQFDLADTFNFSMPVLRKFSSIEEQNNWFTATDKPAMAPFLSTKLVYKSYSGIDSPHGYGEVLQTGYVDTAKLLESYHAFLIARDSIRFETFDHSVLTQTGNGVKYKDVSARHVVFAEGYGMHSNPFFNNLPLDGTKGELFVIRAEKLDLDVAVNTNLFILPLGNHLFKVGATYNWEDKTQIPTPEGKTELIERIAEILTCEYEIIDHLAGVRPTVKDRKPLLGTHRSNRNFHILNGLGTRGVMLGPAMAALLFEHIEAGKLLPREVDIQRFNR